MLHQPLLLLWHIVLLLPHLAGLARQNQMRMVKESSSSSDSTLPFDRNNATRDAGVALFAASAAVTEPALTSA